ncbi:MAG: hypothetical protein IJQ93_11560 [Bacteroidales bacterium]|nr:hypothetical protein [Bacteroidales bacterium]
MAREPGGGVFQQARDGNVLIALIQRHRVQEGIPCPEAAAADGRAVQSPEYRQRAVGAVVDVGLHVIHHPGYTVSGQGFAAGEQYKCNSDQNDRNSFHCSLFLIV